MSEKKNQQCGTGKMKVRTTFGQGRWDQIFEQTVCFTEGDTENQVINIYPEITYETFEGVDGVITQGGQDMYTLRCRRVKKVLMLLPV